MRTVLGLVCALLLAIPAVAQIDEDATMEETFDMVRRFMEHEREQTIEAELAFTEAQRSAFWPIYERYRDEVDRIQDRNAALVESYAANYESISEELALDLIDEYFAIETAMLEIRQRYVPEFREAITAEKLVRFYQMENKIDAAAQLPLMMKIPLVELR